MSEIDEEQTACDFCDGESLPLETTEAYTRGGTQTYLLCPVCMHSHAASAWLAGLPVDSDKRDVLWVGNAILGKLNELDVKMDQLARKIKGVPYV